MIINERKTVHLQHKYVFTIRKQSLSSEYFLRVFHLPDEPKYVYFPLFILCIIFLLASLILEVSIEFRYTCVVFSE